MSYDRVRFLAVRDFLNFKKAYRWQDQSPAELTSEKDQRFYFNVLQGMIRHQRLLEGEIKKRITQPFRKLENSVVGILSLGIYQLMFMDKVPVRASIYESVEMCIPFRVGHKKSLVNAVLRGLQRDLEKDYTPHEFSLPIRTSHQDWMVAQWKQAYSDEEVQGICESNNLFEGITIRAVLPWKAEALAEALSAEQVTTRPHSMVAEALVVENATHLFESTLFKEGAFFIQDASSQIFLELCRPFWKGRVLDLCAAPGGKSIQIAQSPDVQQVICNDVSYKRLEQVQENWKRLRLGRPQLTVSDGKFLPFKSCFDTVLLDAPCSSSGTIRKNPHLKWIASRAELLNKTALQAELLHHAASWVKPQGVLIYATCSLEPEENEHQVQKFLEKHPEFNSLPLQEISNSKDVYSSMLTEEGHYKSLPTPDKMGFFAAIFLHTP